MKTLISFAAVVLLALATAVTASAQPNTANTVLGDPTPSTGTTLDVTFTVFGTTPVVPYEYALQNVCITKKGGSFTIGQHDDIVYWTNQDSGGNPQVTMPVYLQSVPAGSACKVSLVKNNTNVKGSTVSYTVGP